MSLKIGLLVMLYNHECEKNHLGIKSMIIIMSALRNTKEQQDLGKRKKRLISALRTQYCNGFILCPIFYCNICTHTGTPSTH